MRLNELKSGMKKVTEINLNLSSNIIGDSNDEVNFFDKLLLTDTQVWRHCKAFANGLSTNIEY